MIPIRLKKFMESEYFYIDETGWNLKKEAPKKLKEEFEQFKKEFKSTKTGNL